MSRKVLDLLSEDPEVLGFDRVQLENRYNAERDRRYRPEGQSQYVRIEEKLSEGHHDPYMPRIERDAVDDEVEVLLIGGGFASLLAGAHLTKAGVTDLRVVDAAGDFGGTWYWNRYPNAQCDTESYIYLPLLEELGYMPTRNYAYAAEILEHSKAIGRHFGLYRDALFHTEVTDAIWDEAAGRWRITTNRGDRIGARHIVVGTGSLTRPKLPDIPGIADFKGHVFHTSRWDYAYTGGDANGGLTGLADKRVGIVGTGATAVQCVVPLSDSAKELHVFQRTPSAIGIRGNRVTDPAWAASLEPGWQRKRSEDFTAAIEGQEVAQTFPGDGWIDLMAASRKAVRELRTTGHVLTSDELARVTSNVDYQKMNELRGRIESVVKDSETAELLKPWYRPLCKRPCFHDEYLESFNRPNVHLVDAGDGGVERLTAAGAVVGGKTYDLDCLIFATGFETGASFTGRAGFEIKGMTGAKLSDHWADGYKTLFGLTAAGFPNCYFLVRTQTALPQNVPTLLEELAIQAAYLITEARDRGFEVVETTPAGEQYWQAEMNSKRRNSERFYANCTPGYFNNEGQASSNNYGKNIYGGGSIKYFNFMRAWRQRGDLEGVTLRRRAIPATDAGGVARAIVAAR